MSSTIPGSWATPLRTARQANDYFPAAACATALTVALAITAMLDSHIVLAPGLGQAGSRLATMVLMFGVIWLPFSAWSLRRTAPRAARPIADTTDAQTAHQLDTFRANRRDVLTGLQNRAVFLDTLAIQFARRGRLAVLLIDADRFSAFNGLYGDGTGDEVLRVLADRLRTMTGERDHVARLDGDEFALLLVHPEDLHDIEQSAMMVLRRLNEPYPAAGQLVDLTVSIGIATAPQHGETTDTVLRAARLALQLAKQAGGATWRICDQELTEQMTLRDGFREELSAAIEAGQIIPYYQPIVRLPGGDVAKFEVLARWEHPKLGTLTPEQFIPLADELGLSGQVSMSLLRQVALDSASMPAWCRFAINVSAGQVRELISFVSAQPGDWQRSMDLSRLDVEITENALLRDRDMVRDLIDVLHDQGARACLDDFGTGTSNFSHLRDMPFDSIKIGKGFIATLLDDPRVEACVMAMLWLGHGLGIDMVADGVETEETASRLADMGCHFAQGFLYARPSTAAEADRLLSMRSGIREPRAALT